MVDDDSSGSEGDLLPHLDKSCPRSLLRMVDEALEFELGGLARDDVFADNDSIEEVVPSRMVSEGEHEGELNELAGKIFESDPKMNVLLKKVKGVRKEKSIMVLECRTHSKKIL